MIKNFKLFELKYDTYLKASKKAREYGHTQKASNLEDWAYTHGIDKYGSNPKKWGIFSFDVNIYTDSKGNNDFMSGKDFEESMPSILSLKKKGPVKGYLTDIFMDDYINDMKGEEEFEYMTLVCDFIFVDDKGGLYKEKIASGRNKGGSFPIQSMN
jgi:hypothetical protein